MTRYRAIIPCVSIVIMGLIGSFTTAAAAPATTGVDRNQTWWKSESSDNKCGDTIHDEQCYHYVGMYVTHSACFTKSSSLEGVSEHVENQSLHDCLPQQPSGNYELLIYVSDCKVGVVFAKC